VNDDPMPSVDDVNKPQQATVLANVVLLTEKMLCSAREDAWDAVTKYEQERRKALEFCFSTPIPSGQSELFSEALAAMLFMNEEMLSLLEAAKENVAIKRTDHQHAKRSLGHYLDIEKSH
jgi:hypothetical protein